MCLLLLKTANFRYKATFEQIDFSQPRKLDKNLVLRLSRCQWLNKAENVLITGATGVGKSFVASALGHQACLEGFRVLYFNTLKLFSKLKFAKADGSYDKELRKIQRQNLLILDGFGLHPIDEQSKLILLELLEDRYGQSSTLNFRRTAQIPEDHGHQCLHRILTFPAPGVYEFFRGVDFFISAVHDIVLIPAKTATYSG